MATTTRKKTEYENIYTGFDITQVGAGSINPSLYSTEAYRKNKVQKLLIGGLTQIVYGFFEHDHSPLIITLGVIDKYGAILALNLHYVPYQVRKSIIDYIITSNRIRIKKNQPLMLDYHNMVRVVPLASKIVRLYKLGGVRVVETFPMKSWNIAIKQKSKWNGHYKRVGESSETIAQRFFRSIRGFFK